MFIFMKKTSKLILVLSSLFVLSLAGCEYFAIAPNSSTESKSIQESNANSSGNSEDNSDLSEEESSIEEEILEKFDGFAPEGYSLFFEDEFDQNKLSDNWEPMIGDGSDYGVYRWGNNEEQYYKKENAVVKNNALHIIAKREESRTERDTYHFTSARLRTQGKVVTTYGYIEARIKLPAGNGLWPAFWMLPEAKFAKKGWPTSGEIDIMEAKGRILNSYGSAVHDANTSGHVYSSKDYKFDSSTDITEFHCYGLEWTEEYLKFFIDGYNFFSVSNVVYQRNNPIYTEVSSSAPFDRDFHILLNLAIGGNYDGGISVSNEFESAEMVVDYVRIFKKADSGEKNYLN